MIVSLQYLRAVAALMVVAFHASEKLGAMMGNDDVPAFTLGLAGVDIFFVISGFIMLATTRGKDVTPADFARRRFERIVPLYWLLTSLVLFVVMVRPGLLATATFDGAHVAASYLFLPWTHPALDAHLPLLVPGWTLNYEIAFYALFAASLLLPARIRVPGLIVALSLAAFSGLLVPAGTILAFYTDPIILEFAAGLLLASVWQRGLAISRTSALCLVGIGFLLLHLGSHSDLPRIVWAGIPALLIVTGAVHADTGKDRQPMRLPMLLGDASYSIYLSHVIALPVLAKVWIAAGYGAAGAEAPIFLALALVFSALVGAGFYGAVERPLTRAFAARRRRRADEAARRELYDARLRRLKTATESPS